MKIIQPRPFAYGDIITNVPVSEVAWTAGTYSLGTRRYVNTTLDLYEVVVASTTDSPSVGYAKAVRTWERVGKINSYACFDGIVGHPTVGSNLDMYIYPNGDISNGLAFFNVAASTIRVTVMDATGGTITDRVIYDKTISLVDNSDISSWYDWTFAPIISRTDLALIDLPLYSSVRIRIQIPGPFSIGEMVVGRVIELGAVSFGTQVGVLDFSRKERDTFGNAILVQRAFANLATYAVRLMTSRVGYVRRVLSNVRATPIVFIGSISRPETIIYGYYRDLTITLAGPSSSDCSIEVEGLI